MRPDKNYPVERAYMSVVEKAVSEDVKLEEIEHFFPEEPKKQSASQQKSRSEPSAHASEVRA